MPLVTVEDAAPMDPAAIDHALQRVAGAVADALGRPAAEVWARFVATDAARFAGGGRHPIVTVASGEQPADVVELVLWAAADALASALGVAPDAVWARFDVLARGTVLSAGAVQ